MGNALMYRSIGQPALWSLAYILIIAAEGLCGVMLAAGAMAMPRNLRASGADIRTRQACRRRRRHAGVLDLVRGFMVVGGEVVRDVAVYDMERTAIGVSLLHDRAGSSGVR